MKNPYQKVINIGLPKVLVTPHIASATRIDTACQILAENIKRGETQKPFKYLVNKLSGY